MNNIIKKENEKIKELYYYYKDKSGLDVYVFPKNLSTTYAAFATKYGSLENRFKTSEDADFIDVPNGIAHFLEHKMFENEDGSDTFESFGKIGASANAYTSIDKTVYLFSCTDLAEEALSILLDFVTHPHFTKENVAKEQGIIGQELKMYDDNPTLRIYYSLLKLLYVNHNIKISVGGTVESISEITPEILYDCYNTFYDPSNMSLILCGNITVESVEKIVSEYIKPGRNQTIICEYPDEPKEIAGKEEFIKMDVANKLFAIGTKDVNYPDDPREQKKRAIAINILNDLIFGSSSDLYNYLYDNGYVKNSFSAMYETANTCAHNIIMGDSDDPRLVYELCNKEIEKTKSKFPSEDDFKRIQRVTYSEYIKSFDSTEDISNDFIDCLFAGIDMLDIGDIILEIDYEYLKNTFFSFFNEKYTAFSVIEPIKEDFQC